MPRNYDKAAPAQYQRLPEYARDDAWIIQFLQRCEIGHVAHIRNGQPFITPTNFWFDVARHRIIFHSNITGRLRDNLQHDPRVCLEASETGRFLPANTALEFSLQFRSVMVYGQAHILEDPREKAETLTQLIKKYFPHLQPGREYRPVTDKELSRTSVYELLIESWSGKENWAEQAVQLPVWPPLPN